MQRPKTEALFKEAQNYLPGGVNSPVRSWKGLGLTPLVVESGKGSEIIDVDGNRYIDFCGAFGALIHGHSHPQIVEAIQRQAERGSCYGLTSPEEIELGKEIIRRMPSIEQIRFVSSGTEATMSAIRLARGYTGREIIVKFSGHYHGHADPFLAEAGSNLAHLSLPVSKGVSESVISKTRVLPFNNFEAIDALFQKEGKEIAAIILEPIAANMGLVLPKSGFLRYLREKAKEYGALLIFDEVITGFRVGLGGAQGYYEIDPDLTTLGKVIGGGMNAAAFGGKKEIMKELAPLGGVFQAGTLSGNPIAMKAGCTALQLLSRPSFYKDLEDKTKKFLDPIQKVIERKNLPITLNQFGSLFTLFFGVKKMESFEDSVGINREAFNQFFKYLLNNKIYFSPSPYEVHFISAAHTESELEFVQKAILDFFN